MDIDYIIVQAGGKGSRLGYLTANKPKALVPVDNLPMLFHLFRKYPDKRFVVIADHHKDVLREYCASFADVLYQIVDAEGEGTCSGIYQALAYVPVDAPFMLIWSDLVLPETFVLPDEPGSYIGISQSFPCRWSYTDGAFVEQLSTEHGVAGLFIFPDQSILADLPESGELVKWMHSKGMVFQEIGLAGTREFGVLSAYEALGQEKCRPFNRMTLDGEVMVKEPIDKQGRDLAAREQEWYKAAIAKGVENIPKIYGMDPIQMERIRGRNIYEYTDLPFVEKREILRKLVEALESLHQVDKAPRDMFSMKEAYYGKTMDRLGKIRNLVPLAKEKSLLINGRECRNVYFYSRDLERRIEALRCDSFALIHGDCTFSNLMLRDDKDPVFIDPRGYFGYTELYGDPNYDWAKLYYSLAGNYDRFNLKDFRLTIGDNGAELTIGSNQWEALEQDFFAMSGTDPWEIKLIHAVIWLSLTTYAWQDYDSVCGAFYNGLYYLEEVL